MFQNPNVLLDFSNYGPVDDWTQVTVMTLFLLLFIILFLGFLCLLLSCHADNVVCFSNVHRRDKYGR